jgi:hypothetical protein
VKGAAAADSSGCTCDIARATRRSDPTHWLLIGVSLTGLGCTTPPAGHSDHPTSKQAGTAPASHAEVAAIVASEPSRRWSNRRLLLVVSSLIVAVVALAVGIVGVARSLAFVLNAVDATGDVGQITPERGSMQRPSVTAGSDAPNVPLAPSPAGASTAEGTSSSAPPSSVTPAPTAQPGASNPTVETEPAPIAGVAGMAGGGGSGASGIAMGGSAGSAGASNPSPTFWQGFVQSALALLGQTTISMCGRNTCNIGQVCCNASCGTCVAQGATCDQTQCAGGPRTPTNVLCGSGQCNDGLVCCNPSCGICVLPGETCSDQPCR